VVLGCGLVGWRFRRIRVVLVGAVRITVFEEVDNRRSAWFDLLFGLMCSRHESWYEHGGGMPQRPDHPTTVSPTQRPPLVCKQLILRLRQALAGNILPRRSWCPPSATLRVRLAPHDLRSAKGIVVKTLESWRQTRFFRRLPPVRIGACASPLAMQPRRVLELVS
jgi:hypothetical protein